MHMLPCSITRPQGVTRVRFCTDGVLLREMMEDPLLLKWVGTGFDRGRGSLLCGCRQ